MWERKVVLKRLEGKGKGEGKKGGVGGCGIEKRSQVWGMNLHWNTEDVIGN